MECNAKSTSESNPATKLMLTAINSHKVSSNAAKSSFITRNNRLNNEIRQQQKAVGGEQKKATNATNGTTKSIKKINEAKDSQRTKEKEKFAKLKREYKADLSKAKRAKYSSASLSAQRVLKDLKNSASRSISSMKSSFENLLSQKLRIKSPREGHQKSVYDSGCVNYNELENEPRTPVKLYSPFTIETLSPTKSDTYRVFRKRCKIKPSFSMHSELFASPTNKIKDDIRSVTNSLSELSMITDDIRYRFSITTSYSNFSITTQ